LIVSLMAFRCNNKCIRKLVDVLVDRDMTYSLIKDHLESYDDMMQTQFLFDVDESALKLAYAIDFLKPVEQMRERIRKSEEEN